MSYTLLLNVVKRFFIVISRIYGAILYRLIYNWVLKNISHDTFFYRIYWVYAD